jgi:hypothetical protein
VTRVIPRRPPIRVAGRAPRQGLSGPAKAELSLAQGAAAVMPPFAWARLLIPEPDGLAPGEADALVLAEADALALGDGCAEAEEDACGFRLVKSEPRMSSTVPGLRLASSRSVTLEISFLSVFTSAT